MKCIDGVKTYVMMYACFGLFLSQGDRDKGDLCLWSQSAPRECSSALFCCGISLSVLLIVSSLKLRQVDIIINTNS